MDDTEDDSDCVVVPKLILTDQPGLEAFDLEESDFAHTRQHGPRNQRTLGAVIPVVSVENIPVVEEDRILEHEQMSKHYSFVEKQVISWNTQNAKGIYYVRIRCNHSQVWAQRCRTPTITIMDDPINPDYLLAEFDCGFICGVMQLQISGRGALPVSDIEGTGLQFGMQNSPPWPLAKFSSTGLFLLSLQWESRLHEETIARSSQGTIQFLDSILVRFQGTVDLDVVEETVYIEGFKIGHAPAKLTRTEWQKRMSASGYSQLTPQLRYGGAAIAASVWTLLCIYCYYFF